MDIRHTFDQNINELLIEFYQSLASIRQSDPNWREDHQYTAAFEIYNYLISNNDQIQKAEEKAPRLPVVTENLTLNDELLKQADTTVLAQIIRSGGILHNLEYDKVTSVEGSGLILDLNRGVLVSSEDYINSPESANAGYGSGVAEKVEFLMRNLPIIFLDPAATLLFYKHWTQELFSFINETLKGDASYLRYFVLGPAKKIAEDIILNMLAEVSPNISSDANGNIFLDVVSSNFVATQWSGKPKDDVAKHFPGTVLIRFQYTDQGWQLISFKASNPEIAVLLTRDIEKIPKLTAKFSDDFLSPVIFPEMRKYEENLITKAIAQLPSSSANVLMKEYKTLRSALQKINQPELQQAILEMTSLVLQEPFNSAVLSNYYKLLSKVENEAMRQKLEVAMKTIISHMQQIDAPRILQKLIPKLITSINKLLTKQNKSVDQEMHNYITLNAINDQIKQLPAPWNEVSLLLDAFLKKPNQDLFAYLREINHKYIFNVNVFPKVAQNLASASGPDKLLQIFNNIPSKNNKMAKTVVKELNKNENFDEKTIHRLIDNAIYIAMVELTYENSLHPLLRNLANQHRGGLSETKATQQIIQSYIINFMLLEIEPSKRKIYEEALEQRLLYYFSDPNFIKNYQSLVKFDIGSIPLQIENKKVRAYPGISKMWKKGKEDIKNDKEQKKSQGSSEKTSNTPDTSGPEGRKG